MPFKIRAANTHTVQKNHSSIVLRPQQPNFVEDTYMFAAQRTVSPTPVWPSLSYLAGWSGAFAELWESTDVSRAHLLLFKIAVVFCWTERSRAPTQ